MFVAVELLEKGVPGANQVHFLPSDTACAPCLLRLVFHSSSSEVTIFVAQEKIKTGPERNFRPVPEGRTAPI